MIAYAAAILSGLLLPLAFPPRAWYGLLAFALLPLLWAAARAKNAKAASNLGALAGLIYYAQGLSWLAKVFSPWVAFAFWCIFSLWLALFAGLFHWLWNWRRERRGAWQGIFVALASGALWVGPEYFRSEVWWLNNSFLALGYGLAPQAALRQSASIIGVYGLSWLVLSFNCSLLIWLKGRGRTPLLVSVALLAGLWIWGVKRSQQNWAEQGRPLEVALIQDESLTLERLARMSRSQQAQGADLLLWPEYTLPAPKGYEQATDKLLANTLKDLSGLTVIGAYDHPDDLKQDSSRWRNYALLWDQGRRVGEYDKLHPIPVVEHFLKPNPKPHPIDTRLGRLGVQICYDLDFENGSRFMAGQGAEVLLVPNMDPMDWGLKQHAQHSAMAPLRALESGLWIARAASSGRSQIIDPSGRILLEMEDGKSGVLRGGLRLGAARTFYVQAGHWLGPLALAVSCLFWLLGLVFLRKRE